MNGVREAEMGAAGNGKTGGIGSGGRPFGRGADWQSAVSRIGNPQRPAFSMICESSTPCRMPFGDTADCQSALLLPATSDHTLGKRLRERGIDQGRGGTPSLPATGWDCLTTGWSLDCKRAVVPRLVRPVVWGGVFVLPERFCGLRDWCHALRARFHVLHDRSCLL